MDSPKSEGEMKVLVTNVCNVSEHFYKQSLNSISKGNYDK
jgi:hypothetical protein